MSDHLEDLKAQHGAIERAAVEQIAEWLRGDDAERIARQADDWPERRPATTIAGDVRVFQPGGHHIDGQQSANAVRVTLAEALVLQSFPPDYPVAGSKTKQYEQVGNAVPPLLAWHVLSAVVHELKAAA